MLSKIAMLISIIMLTSASTMASDVLYVGGGAIVNAGSYAGQSYLTIYSGSGLPNNMARNVTYDSATGQTSFELNYQGLWLPVTVTYSSVNVPSTGRPAIIPWSYNNVGFGLNGQYNVKINFPQQQAVTYSVNQGAYNPQTGEAIREVPCYEDPDQDKCQ